jgi:hemerythrin-like metal-binding protein
MELITWRDEFSLGIPSVDYEHRELISLINELYENYTVHGSDVTTQDFLGELYAKIASHFALEEKIMQERKYDQYREHKSEHEKLLDEIRDFMEDIENHHAFPEGVFRNLLEVWFLAHFKSMDARLHRFLQ